MSIRQVVAAAVRLFALYLLYVCIELIGSLAASGAIHPNAGVDDMARFFMVSSAISLGVSAVVALVLLMRTDVVVAWVVPALPHDAELAVDSDALTLVVLMVAGLGFFANGVESLLATGASWFFAAKDPDTGSRPLVHFEPARVVGGAFKAAFGAWLVLGGRGLLSTVKTLRSLRGMPGGEGGNGADA
jgi:hypothetical protein